MIDVMKPEAVFDISIVIYEYNGKDSMGKCPRCKWTANISQWPQW